MRTWNYIVGLSKVLWLTIVDGIDDKIFKMSAALAFYTILSIAPILLLVISVADYFFGRQAVEGHVFEQIRELVGEGPALEIQNVIANSAISEQVSFATILSVCILIFTATGVFTEIQDSINTIWRLKPKPKKGWLKLIFNRLLSFSMLISLAFLLMVTLVVNALLSGLGEKLTSHFPQVSLLYAAVLNSLLAFGTTVLLFGGIFKVLPDAKIGWRHVLGGAIFTALLFMLGKWGISFYLGTSKINTTYGAAGGIIILMLWVYYSAIILYFGAEFTRHYAQWKGSRIYPTDYAVWVESVEIERKDQLPENPLLPHDTPEGK